MLSGQAVVLAHERLLSVASKVTRQIRHQEMFANELSQLARNPTRVAVPLVSNYDSRHGGCEAVESMTEGFQHGQETEFLRQLTELVRTESNDGARLVSNLADNPVCRVTLDASVPCIFVVWQRYATSAQLRFVHECLLDLLRREHMSRILADDSSLAVIHVDDQVWLCEDWLPRAAAAGLRAAASKSPYAFFGKQSVANVQSGAPASIRLRSFDTLGEAKAWLAGMAH